MLSPQQKWGDPRRRMLNQEIAKLIQLRRSKNLSYTQAQEVEEQIKQLYAQMPPVPREAWYVRLWEWITGS